MGRISQWATEYLKREEFTQWWTKIQIGYFWALIPRTFTVVQTAQVVCSTLVLARLITIFSAQFVCQCNMGIHTFTTRGHDNRPSSNRQSMGFMQMWGHLAVMIKCPQTLDYHNFTHVYKTMHWLFSTLLASSGANYACAATISGDSLSNPVTYWPLK